VVLVHDAEPTPEPRNPLRAEALVALAQALNGPTRAALISLRAGGNRVGAESVMTWQAGYPVSVDYSRGYPRYTPDVRGLDVIDSGRYKAALIVGSPVLDPAVSEALGRMSTAVVGPRATQAAFATRVAIDTGVAGIHEGGTAYRADDVPLRLRPPLERDRSAVDVLRSVIGSIRSHGERKPS
jgi:formylmethanofuran dehydrogenase subunit B